MMPRDELGLAVAAIRGRMTRELLHLHSLQAAIEGASASNLEANNQRLKLRLSEATKLLDKLEGLTIGAAWEVIGGADV